MMIHQTPSRHDLKTFGLIMAGAVLVFFVGVPVLLLGRGPAWWPFAVSAVLALLGLAAPMALRRPYQAWMRFGWVMNAIMTRLILGLVFYVMITPMGIVRRLLGSDPMHRRFDPEAQTYRVEPHHSDTHNMETQF